MDGGGDASQTVNRGPGSLCSSTLIPPNLTRALDHGAGDSNRAVRSPQGRPAFLQSRYEDSPINALAGLSPKIVRPALYREWLSLHARAHPPLSGNTSSTWPTRPPPSIRNHCRSRRPERAHRYSNSDASPDPAVIQLVGAFRAYPQLTS